MADFEDCGKVECCGGKSEGWWKLKNLSGYARCTTCGRHWVVTVLDGERRYECPRTDQQKEAHEFVAERIKGE